MRFELPVAPTPIFRTLYLRTPAIHERVNTLLLALQVGATTSLALLLPVQYNRVAFRLPSLSAPSTTKIALEVPVISIPVEAMTFATGDGEQVFDAVVKCDVSGNALATFRMATKPRHGARVSLVLNESVTVFSGIVTEVKTTQGAIGYAVTVVDDLKALADSKVIVPKAADVADAFREVLADHEIPLYDESQKTYFPTYYTGDEILLKTLREILEACRGARVYLLPEGGYVLSNSPRRWHLDQGKCFECADTIDVSGYANRITVFVDEEFTRWIETLSDTTKSFGNYSVRMKSKGEQTHYLKAARGVRVVAEESSVWNERNFLTQHSAMKDGVVTTTNYTIVEPEGFVPVVSLRIMESKDPSDTDKPFMRREIESVSMGYNRDGSQFAERKLVIQWYEKVATLSGG
jgi:hypothetical protein